MNDQQTRTVAVLTGAHREYLASHAVSDGIIESTGILSLDEGTILFPWQDGDQLTAQLRPWPEPPGGLPEGVPKYRWEAGRPLHFWAIRPLEDTPDDTPVILTEGTKQSLAVASWAPDGYAVYGMAGCDAWRKLEISRLDRFAG